MDFQVQQNQQIFQQTCLDFQMQMFQHQNSQQQLVVVQSHNQMMLAATETDSESIVDEEFEKMLAETTANVERIKAEVAAATKAFEGKKVEGKKVEDKNDNSRFFGECETISEKITAARNALKKEIADYESNRKSL